MSLKYLKAVIVIALAFSIGLVFFFIFSAPYRDGLEKTMELGGIEEEEPIYKAPFDYGDNYIVALLMGLFGFAIVFGCMYIYGKLIST